MHEREREREKIQNCDWYELVAEKILGASVV